MKTSEAIQKIGDARAALKEMGWAANQAQEQAKPENVETVKDVLANLAKATQEIDSGLRQLADDLAG